MRIAQGKRIDTLGKPPHHATPCKGKSKRNTLCFSTFTLTWRNLHGNIIPRVPLRLPLGYELLPLWGVPVLTSTNTTLRLRKICAICRAKGAICGSPSPRTASVQIRGICGKIKTRLLLYAYAPSTGRISTHLAEEPFIPSCHISSPRPPCHTAWA